MLNLRRYIPFLCCCILAISARAQLGLNLNIGAAGITSGSMMVRCRVVNGQTTPVSYASERQFINLFGAQYYYGKGEFPFCLEFNYSTGNFFIAFKDDYGNMLRLRNYRQNIFGGGITVEPIQKPTSKWRYGFGIYAYGYVFLPRDPQSEVGPSQMLNFFLGVEGGYRLNKYFYLNAQFRYAPFETDYVKAFKGLIPANYSAGGFKMMQRDRIAGMYLSFDFASWVRDTYQKGAPK